MNKELNINKEKFQTFLEVAKELNKRKIVPILFGSLGLMKIVGEFKKADDIDILIEEEMLKEKWEDLVDIMESIGFNLRNKKECEFERKNKIVGFAKISDLRKFKINADRLEISKEKDVEFKELSVQEYLTCYQEMSRDNYRQEKKGKDDQAKIKIIKAFGKRY